MGALAWAWGQLYAWAVEQVVGRIGWCDGEDALLQVALWVGSVPGWRSIFCHMAVWCGSRSAVVRAGGCAVAGEVASFGTGRPGVVAYASAG